MMFAPDFSREFFQLSQKPIITDQWLTAKSPTTIAVKVGRTDALEASGFESIDRYRLSPCLRAGHRSGGGGRGTGNKLSPSRGEGCVGRERGSGSRILQARHIRAIKKGCFLVVSSDPRGLARSVIPGMYRKCSGRNPGERLDTQKMVFASRKSRRDISRDRHPCIAAWQCQPPQSY
jgi:hypothetical protein